MSNTMLARILASTVLLSSLQITVPADANRPIQVVLVSGVLKYYDSTTGLQHLRSFLDSHSDMNTRLLLAESETSLPGLEALETCDVLVLFARRLEIDGEQLAALKAYIQAGRPLVAIRTSSHAFQNWLEMDAEILGGNYQGHHAEGPVTRAVPLEAQMEHPVMENIDSMTSTSTLYRTKPVAADVTVLMEGQIEEDSQPLAWVREREPGQRVFYTSLGSVEDFKNTTFCQLVMNAINWVAGEQQGCRHGESNLAPAGGDATGRVTPNK